MAGHFRTAILGDGIWKGGKERLKVANGLSDAAASADFQRMRYHFLEDRGKRVVLVVGFFVFRVLDVFKPWPARRLEDLPGGSGIMADDLMVGLYTNLILHGLASWRPLWLGVA